MISLYGQSLQYHIQATRGNCTHRRLTAKFSGAVNGNQRNHAKCAARPPLQRLVRQSSNGALYATALIPPLAAHPILASAPLTPALSLSGIPSAPCLSPQGCLTPAFSGAVNGIGRSMRIALHGLRCNALLDVCAAYSITPSHAISRILRSLVRAHLVELFAK